MIQVYTGKGKGKTTAALGLALRASGAGLHVYIGQFMKSGYCNELNSLKTVRNIKIEQFGTGCLIKKKANRKDKESAKKGLQRVKHIIKSKRYQLVILDEINVALYFRLLSVSGVIKLLKDVSPETELVLTGRNAPDQIKKIADLVSEIEEIKHYYKKGIKNRKGIEF